MYEVLAQVRERHFTPKGVPQIMLRVRCLTCGNEQTVVKQSVVRANQGNRKHCPVCYQADAHRMTGTRFHSIWLHMVSRASNPNDQDYWRYGGAGRGVSEDWREFRNFYRDTFLDYADDLTIDRRDNNQGYSKENCRWTTNMVQQSNKSNNRVIRYQDRDMHLAEFCRMVGASRGAMTARLNNGMTGDQAAADYATSKYPKNRKSRQSTT